MDFAVHVDKWCKVRAQRYTRTRASRVLGPAFIVASGLLLLGLLTLVSGIVLLAHTRTFSGSLYDQADGVGITRSQTSSTATPSVHPEFQAGFVFKGHVGGAYNYGPDDQTWQTGLPAIQSQIGARWIELVLNLNQNDPGATHVYVGPNTPTVDHLASAIDEAHSLGMKVFLVPLVTPIGSDSMHITFGDDASTAAWFASYWSALQPYLHMAQQHKVDQAAIGIELSGLEHAPDADWNTLISQVHQVYSGPLTYDVPTVSWTRYAQHGVPAWMHNAALTYLGIQEYASMVSQPGALSEPQLEAVWHNHLLPMIDAFAHASGKPLIISEIGYRNSDDLLYNPALSGTSSPQNPTLQAAAYQAAATAVLTDANLHGIYFFAWDLGIFAPSTPAQQTVHAIYSQLS